MNKDVAEIWKKTDLISELGLSQAQVVKIVSEWYTNGMYAEILMEDTGLELDEVCDEILEGLTK